MKPGALLVALGLTADDAEPRLTLAQFAALCPQPLAGIVGLQPQVRQDAQASSNMPGNAASATRTRQDMMVASDGDTLIWFDTECECALVKPETLN